MSDWTDFRILLSAKRETCKGCKESLRSDRHDIQSTRSHIERGRLKIPSLQPEAVFRFVTLLL